MQWAVSNSAEQRGWRGRQQEVARGWKPPCTGEYRIYISSGSDVRSEELPLTGFQGLAFLGLCSSFLCFFLDPCLSTSPTYVHSPGAGVAGNFQV